MLGTKNARYLILFSAFYALLFAFSLVLPILNGDYELAIKIWQSPDQPSLRSIAALNLVDVELTLLDWHRNALIINQLVRESALAFFALALFVPFVGFELPWMRNVTASERGLRLVIVIGLFCVPLMAISLAVGRAKASIVDQLLAAGVDAPLVILDTAAALQVWTFILAGLWAQAAFSSIDGNRFSNQLECLRRAFPDYKIERKDH